jgi:gliding motility-associated-like protein
MPHKPNAAAYQYESTLPPCNWLLDLATHIDTTIHRYDTICSGTIALLDENIAVFPNLEFDSLSVAIQNSLDGMNEWVTVTNTAADVAISGNDSQQLTLASTGFTKGNAFLSVLRTLQYTNNAPLPTLGGRILLVTLYHPYYGELTAQIFVEVAASGSMVVDAEMNMPSCYGYQDGSIDLGISGGQAPYSISWEDGSQHALRPNLATGNYAFLVLDAAQCKIEDTLTLTQPDSLLLTLTTPLDRICGSNGVIVPLVVGGTAAYSFAWEDGSTDSLHTNLTAGAYSLLVADAEGCTDTASMTLFPVEALFASFSQQACLGQGITIAGDTYTQNASFQVNVPTPAGCDSLVSIELIFADTFYQAWTYELCPGEQFSIYGLLVENDSSLSVPFTTALGCDSIEYYQVNFTDYPSTTQTVEICEGENYLFGNEVRTTAGFYQDTISNAGGCDSISILHLVVHPLPIPNITTSGSLCTGDEVLLSTQATYTSYQWNDGSAQASLLVISPADYSVSVIDAMGCAGFTTISITDSPPTASYVVNQPACPDSPASLTFTAINGGSAPYYFNNALVNLNQEIGAFPSGNYVLPLTDNIGCQTELSFTVTPSTDFSASLISRTEIKLGESVELPLVMSASISSITWSPSESLSCSDCQNPIAHPLATTRYFVTLTDGEGCTWDGSILVQVEFSGLYIPNAFSPNNDNNNDTFQLFPSTSVQTVGEVAIFDRWGAQVFQANGLTPAWDGRIKGENAPTGMYVYRVSWVDVAGNAQVNAGEVLLLR